jgi:CBS domain-containing protein
VVEGDGRCAGIITQNDLISRAKMPTRLGLMRYLPTKEREAWLRTCEGLRCGDIMTKPPRLIDEDAKAAAAIKLMNHEALKRLPVIDGGGKVVGILSRIDILRTIAATRVGDSPASPGDPRFSRYVEGLSDRDHFSLEATTGLKAAIDALVAEGRQRAAVVDKEDRLVGLITDRLLVQALGARGGGKARKASRPVSEIMERDLKVATETMTTYEALGLMTEFGHKRIPVVDSGNIFRGMIRRDSILLAFSRLWEKA